MVFEILSCVVFFATQLADGISTYIGLKRGGVETNPLLKWASKSPLAILLIKAGIGLGVAVFEAHQPYLPGIIVMDAVSGYTGYMAIRGFEKLLQGHN